MKNTRSSRFRDLSSQEKSQNKKMNNVKNNQNAAKKSHKKELRKINKESSKKAEKKISLVRPIMFEESSFSNKINNQKLDSQVKNLIQTPTFFNKIDFNFNNNFFDKELSKKINIINDKNNIKFPIIPINPNLIINNKTLNDSTIITNYKEKFFAPKPHNTFNVLKFQTTTDLPLEENNNNPLLNSSNNPDNINNANKDQKNTIVKDKNIRKGRKAKSSKNFYSESKHTKFSEDNMMRKIKNKIIESSRLLANKLFLEEIKYLNDKCYYMVKEFRKIKGSFSQELNIKFNLYFYQMKIKDIFSLELSHKYTAIEKNSNSNKELIDYIFSEQNKNFFNKTKQILDMQFHQYYHDIFLGEDKTWKFNFGIDLNDDKYQIENLLNSFVNDEKDKNNENNKIYAKNLNTLAHHYEDFFLSKKTRNVELGDKKEDCIKLFMETTTEEQYKYYFEQLKQYKKFYENRSGIVQEQKIKNPFILNFKLIEKDNLKINEINNNNTNNNNFDSLTLVKFNTDSSIKHQINNKENENKLNSSSKITKEVIFKVNIEKDNNFCGKKRKLDFENEKDNNTMNKMIKYATDEEV